MDYRAVDNAALVRGRLLQRACPTCARDLVPVALPTMPVARLGEVFACPDERCPADVYGWAWYLPGGPAEMDRAITEQMRWIEEEARP